eukprot:GEMP01054228.1.p1 GENE.GEMP01054228.1~~GEMP01054228.1.p1  ORF type:complete len:431 (+),score=69.62 GEMP01054228.1:114-1406(+)
MASYAQRGGPRKCETCGQDDRKGWSGAGDWSHLWYCEVCWLESPEFCDIKVCATCDKKKAVEWTDKSNDKWAHFDWYCNDCWKEAKVSETCSSCCCSEADAFYPVKLPAWKELELSTIHEGELFDTHIHLEGLFEKDTFPHDLHGFLRALSPDGAYGPPDGSSSVTIITSACDEASIEPTKRMFEELESNIDLENIKLYFEVGWHPKSSETYTQKIEDELRSLCTLFAPRLVAIGECGLDYAEQWVEKDGMWGKGTPTRQAQLKQVFVFERICDIALELDLPLCVHSREAERDTLDVFERKLPTDYRIQLHCYGNSIEFMELLLVDWPNAMISMAGHLTYPSSREWNVRPLTLNGEIETQDLHEHVRRLPLNRLLLETDGPYMAPTPYIGTSALPAHIVITAQAVADIKQVTLDAVLIACRENARKFFGV